MLVFLPLILAAVVTTLLIPLLETRAGALRVLDAPGPRKVHAAPVPRVGGIAMAVGIGLAVVIWAPLDRAVVAVMLGALVVLLFGVWDDRRNLKPGIKLLGQLIAIAIAVFGGDVTVHSLTFAGRVELPAVLALPLTFAFLVGVTNAINLADGLDGLAGGTALLCCAAIAALILGGDTPALTVAVFAVIGSLLGFLRFNTYPARVFMGDGGSQLLGFLLGILAIGMTQGGQFPYSAALPLLLLGLPIIDTLTVILLRVREGRSPFSADRNHLHHRLLALGFDHFEAVVVIYLLQGALFVLAWFMRYQSDLAIVAVFAACAASVVGLLIAAENGGWRWQGAGAPRLGEILARRVPWLKAPTHLPRWGNGTAWALVSVYLVIVATLSTAISRDVAWLAAALAALIVAVLLRWVPLRLVGGLVHGAAFVTMAIAVYLDHVEPGEPAAFVLAKWVLFPLLTLAVVVRLRFWRERRFELTPLDVLVVFLALVVPNLPGLQGAASNVGLSVAKLVVLMYATEMLIRHSDRTRAWLWRSAALALGIVALRGLMG